MRYPDVAKATWSAEGLEVLPESEAAKVRERSGKDSRALAKYGMVEKENDTWIAILERSEVTAEQSRLLARKSGLEARGIAVHRVPFGNHTEDGGSVRCATHPLVRRLRSRS